MTAVIKNVKGNRVFGGFIFTFFCLLAVAGQAPLPTPVPALSESSLIHFGDVIDIDFVGAFEYDWRGTLTPEGNLAFDTFGAPIPALCRTEAEIAADVVKVYSKLLRAPKVVVRIIDRSNRAVVTLSGAVRTPMRFKLLRPVRLRELIVRSGGFTDDTSGEITLFRPANLNCERPVQAGPQSNGSRMLIIKISDLLRGDPAADIQILSGDTLDVARASAVYVIGAVNNPRPVYSRAEITLSRAVASAGGLAKDSDGGRVTIFRREGTEITITEADLAKIKRGETNDVVLKPFDIIDVAGKGGSKRKFPPVAPSTDNSADKRELPIRVID